MAEDDATANDLTGYDGDDDTSPSRPQTAASSKKRQSQKSRRHQPADGHQPKCRPRIDQLAIPSRRLILALYQDHADHLPREKVEKIKALLQELYAMTPEETEKYFEHLRKQAKEVGRRKDIKYMLKRLVKRKKKAKQIRKAYEFIENLLTKSMEYAAKHPIPPLVSIRLRNLSNIILEQICDLRNVNIPDRENPDQVGFFMLQVADWMAVAVEQLYYGVQLKKNRELEKIEKDAREMRERDTKQRPKTDEGPAGKRGPEKSEHDDDEKEGGDTEAIISEPLSVSEME